MKKIIGLNQNIKDYKGKEIVGEDGKPATTKDFFLNVIGGTQSKDGRDSMIIDRAGRKMADTEENEIEVEDYDYSLIKKAVESCQWATLIKSALMNALGEKL